MISDDEMDWRSIEKNIHCIAMTFVQKWKRDKRKSGNEKVERKKPERKKAKTKKVRNTYVSRGNRRFFFRFSIKKSKSSFANSAGWPAGWKKFRRTKNTAVFFIRRILLANVRGENVKKTQSCRIPPKFFSFCGIENPPEWPIRRMIFFLRTSIFFRKPPEWQNPAKSGGTGFCERIFVFIPYSVVNRCSFKKI